MSQAQWSAVDQYINDALVGPDPILDAVVRDSDAAGLPPIAVSPSQGKLLQMLAQMQGARAILEIGTLAGFSTLWLARALPAGGRLITLEIDVKHAEIARDNFARAGLSDTIELQVGRALDILPRLVTERRGPFDLIFIDADKQSSADYFAWALKLSRAGTLIIVDNVVRGGAVLDASTEDPHVQGVRRLYQRLAAEPRVSASAIQTVGSKGYDGIAFIKVLVADAP